MEHLHLHIIFPDFPSKSSVHRFFFPYVPNISHDFPMIFPLKWPFWSRRNPSHEPILAGVSLLAHWATSSSSRDRATGRISQYLCGYGSIPINTIFNGMNIHLPAILMWTTGVQGFDTLQFVYFMCLGFGCFFLFFFLSLSLSLAFRSNSWILSTSSMMSIPWVS